MKTLIAAFSDSTALRNAEDHLRIREVQDTTIIAGQAMSGDGRQVLHTLAERGIPENRAELYAEIVRRGGSLLIATVHDDEAEQLADDLDELGSLDVDANERRWRDEGWTGYDVNAKPVAAAATEAELEASELEPPTGIEVLEEEVTVGKREVSATRVRTFITEHPEVETVELHEERIDVTREPANEPIEPSAADSTLREDEFTVTTTSEEAVVGKEARVVERVHVGKPDESKEPIEESERPVEAKKEEEAGKEPSH